jgi:hypothetical protein
VASRRAGPPSGLGGGRRRYNSIVRNNDDTREAEVKREQFDALTVDQVRQHAAAEGPPIAGKPEFYDRPWSQLLVEMEAASAASVGELPTLRGDVFFHSTGSVYGDLGDLLSGGSAREEA